MLAADYNEEQRLAGMREDARAFKIIEATMAASGNVKAIPKPGEVFTSLAEIWTTEQDDGDDDPRRMFDSMTAVLDRSGGRRLKR